MRDLSALVGFRASAPRSSFLAGGSTRHAWLAPCIAVLCLGGMAMADNKVLRLDAAQAAGNAGSSSAWQLPNTTGELTIEFWLRLEPATQTQTAFGRPVSLRGCSCGGITFNAFALGSIGRIEVEFGAIDAWSASEFSLSKWHHFACTWSRARRKIGLYLDGVLVFERNISPNTSIQVCGQPQLRFGEQCGRGLVGAIDNVRYWTVERSAAELIANMSMQYTPAVASATAGLIGSWAFDDGQISNGAGVTSPGTLEGGAAIASEPLLPDCNGDGIVDFGQILAGQFEDVNRNGILDRACECLGDIDQDGGVTGADLGLVLAVWGAAAPGAPEDLNADGAIDGFDLAYLLAGWGDCGQ